ncbi:beta-galactosidase [Spirochaetia bacterium]|nr:beta-galactosidase [Spirochaetia bacterium]
METIYLQHWKFSLDNQATLIDPWAPLFDDSPWQDVIVPHDWAVSFPFSRENSSGTGYLPGGTGWYRTRFTVPKGRRNVSIAFDGVYKHSQVWCNGYYLGERAYGYSSFRYDISHCVREGDDNYIAVKVSHEDIADSRWYTGSGIYRKVSLELYDAIQVNPESVIVHTECPNSNTAVVHVAAELLSREAAEDAQVTLSLADKDGAVHKAAVHIPRIEANTPYAIKARIDVPAPKLWSPDTPDLYRLIIEGSAKGSGATISFTAAPLKIGIRSIKFDPDKGFFINGVSQKIKGVCMHHDAGALGAAVWPDVWRRRLEKLKALGCNAVRMSHNPHMNELYDLCDEMGFFVMEEAFDEWEGCKNKWFHGHNVYPPVHQGYYEDFPQWHEQDIADMVIRGRNHPAIIFWSIGNEIDYPNDPYAHPLFAEMTGNNDANKPQAERVYNPQKPNMERLAVIAAELAGIVKKYDPTRPVLTAAAFPELSSKIKYFDALDMVGYNYKEQFYEADHKRFPKLPIIGSENGHSLAAWKAVRDNEYISGQFLWTGIDFLGEAHGWPIRGSRAGILDTAGNEKTGYFRRKALWSSEPVLYLATRIAPAEKAPGTFLEMYPAELYRSWNYRPGQPIQIICYTNLAKAELFCNGKSCGVEARTDDREYIAWTLPFERGTLEVRGISSTGAPVKDTLESTLPAVKLRLRLWEPTIDVPQQSHRTVGAYRLNQIELELLDEKDRLCTTENPLVQISLTGPGKLAGIENGDLSDCSEYPAPRRRAYRGKLIIYVLSPAAGGEKTTLTVSAEGYADEVIGL